LQHASSATVSPETLAVGIGSVDCPAFDGVYDYVAWATGATLTGADLLWNGKADVAFNPSGGFHHAAPGLAAGFCYINDIVLGAMTLANHGLKVAVLDVDVHHLDGVQDAFYARDDILTISMHEDGRTLFPGTGAVHEIGTGRGKGFAVNIPLPVGTYNAIYYKAFTEVVLPMLQKFGPDIIVLELGMDALAGDPLAHLNLTNTVYIDLIKDVMNLNVPILATGGGGYHVDNTVRAWTLAWSVLCSRYEEHPNIGLGGVMMENTDWIGGLRDRAYLTDGGQRAHIDAEVDTIIKSVQGLVFPIHGIRSQ
jgi:acetoin utilization deacetylase AcuC-like enzyme